MKTKLWVIVGSLVAGLVIVVGAVLLSGGGGDGGDGGSGPEPEAAASPRPVTLAELQAADGQAGRPCLVAVDGTVYEIDGFLLWQDGEHIPSEGQAYCGADMTEAIRQAPHGTSKLDLLTEVGPLVE